MDEAKKPEDGLEHIARKAAEEARFEFNPDAWAAMEQRLGPPQRKPFAWWKAIVPLAIVAIIMLIIFWPGATTNKSPGSENPNTKAPQANSLNNATADSTEKSKNQGLNKKIVGKDISTARQEVSKTGPTQVQSHITEKPESGNKETMINTAKATSGHASLPTIQETIANSITDSQRTDLGAIVPMWVPQAYFTGKPILKLPDTALMQETEPDSTKEKSNWEFSVFVSADLSSTGLDGFTKPGTMFGASAAYFISEKWSLQTGAAVSIKKYKALGSEYELPPWAQGSPYSVNSINAVCKVIDIPINLRRHFESKKDHSYFIGAGVSSYLMLREDYEYEYSGYRPSWPAEWRVKNKNQHYLGVLNLSFGYEKPIGQKFALGIEPFFKIPLSGVGEGKVKLLSVGANLAIKLRD